MIEKNAFNQSKPLQPLIHPDANIHKDAVLGPLVSVGAGATIGAGTHIGAYSIIQAGVHIGEHCRIGPHVMLTADVSHLEYWREKQPANYPFPRLEIGDGTSIGASSSLYGDIRIGRDSWIGSNVTFHDGARIGERCRVYPGAVISAIPQDLKFDGERTTLEVGDDCVIRECVTLNRGTSHSGKTRIGKHCLLMAYTHVAHDCVLGDHVIMANAVNLAGHVEIGDHVVIGGMTGVHQFTKIGPHAMIAAGCLVRKDVPPFIKAGRNPLQYQGVNSIGLRRRGCDRETILRIQETYRHIFLSGKNNAKALDIIEKHVTFSDERDQIVNFIRNSERGIIKGHGK